jgi:hypothetical protein
MPYNGNTENPPLDVEDWRIAFNPYNQHPLSALTLAHHLAKLKEYVQNDAAEAKAAIDRAVDCLYEHSEFRSVSFELFRVAVEGRMTSEQENVVHELGIKT